MKLIIEQDRETVAVLENYEGPIPRAGEYIYHPPLQDAGQHNDWSGKTRTVAGCVGTVTYGIYARPLAGGRHFTATEHPFVVITIV